MAKLDKLSFEELTKKIEDAVSILENNETKLEESLKIYEETLELVKLAEKKLTEIEQKIQIVNEEDK